MKVSAILKGMIDSNGHQPIQIRIYHNNKSTYKPTKIKVPPSQFKKGRVVEHPKSREYNQDIARLIIMYQSEALEGFKKKVTRINFYDYLNKVIPTLTRTSGSLRQYGTQIIKLKTFAPSLYLDQIDKDFLNAYHSHLKAQGLSQNTIWSSFKFLRKFVRTAYKDRLIERYPFDNFEFPRYEQTNRTYLTVEEIRLIDKFVTPKLSPKLYEAGTWFLIACYTGLRVSDIKNFSRKNIVGDRLVVKMQKTREMVGLPISPRLRKYFERVQYKPLSMHENTYNELLKVIAAASGVDKRISSHTGRHSAAMMLANAGVSQEVVAKILGHVDLKSTAAYFKITNKRVDKEMKKLK